MIVNATNGIFKLSFKGQSTGTLCAGTIPIVCPGGASTETQVKNALAGLSTIGAGNVDVHLVNGVYEIEFISGLLHADEPEIGVDLGVLGQVNLGLINDGTRQTIDDSHCSDDDPKLDKLEERIVMRARAGEWIGR